RANTAAMRLYTVAGSTEAPSDHAMFTFRLDGGASGAARSDAAATEESGGRMAGSAFTELRSPRLILRRLRPDGRAWLCAYRSLPEVARYQDWESFGPDEAARLIDGQAGLEPGVPGTWFQLAIVEAATGLVVGDCGLHCRQEDPRQMEVGISLAPAHQ